MTTKSESPIAAVIQATNRLHNHPWLTIIAFLVITIFALGSAGNLQINATPYMIDKEHPSRMADDRVKGLFTNAGEQAFIAVVSKQGDVFNAESLALVSTLTQAFKSMTLSTEEDATRLSELKAELPDEAGLINNILENGLNSTDAYALSNLVTRIDQNSVAFLNNGEWLQTLIVRINPVRKVRSLVTLENITSTTDGIDIHPLMQKPISDIADIQSLKQEVFQNPLFLNSLISEDARATSIQLEFNIAEDDSPSMLLAYQAINAIISNTDLGANSLHLSGPPMIASETASNMEKDNQTLLPGVLLVILVVLLISFGRIQGMIIPLLIAILSLIWTLAIMSAMGVKQNIITSMLPVFIIAIAVCDAIHFLSDYYRHLPEYPTRKQRSKAASSAITQLFWPMLVTTITTAIGFMSLAWTEVTFIQEFGFFVGIGVIIAWAITIFFLPTILVLWKSNPPKVGLLASTRLDNVMEKFSGVAKVAKPAVVVTLCLIVGSAFYISNNLKVDNQVIGYFEETSQIRVDDKVLNEHFGGTTPISILIESGKVNAFQEAEYVAALDAIEARLNEHEIVGFTYGLPDFIKRLNQALNNTMTAEAYSLPSSLSTELLGQYFLLYENGNGRDLFDVVDRRYQNSRIVTILHTDRSSEVSKVIDDVMLYSAFVLPQGSTIKVSGYGEILVATTNAVVWGQVSSLVLAGILIMLVVLLIFRSPSIAILVPLPLILTLLGVFAIMAAAGVDLDIGTSIIAAISFGIGIDYSIHIISALKSSKSTTRLEQIRDALKLCGKPILINTLALGAGFLVLTLSGYQALINLGYFISITMFLSAIFSLLVLPAIVANAVNKDKNKDDVAVETAVEGIESNA
ncbi:MAG: putative RND superfamily exporter protein [Oleispira sp.]|jgi:predicted RND superfamily exporter protein